MQSNPQSKKAGCMGMRKKHRVEGLQGANDQDQLLRAMDMIPWTRI